jgi:hypothetical protein
VAEFRRHEPIRPRSRQAKPVGLESLSGRLQGSTHTDCDSNQNAIMGSRGLDLEALRAEPGLIDELAVEDLPALLERCAVEHGRVAVVERLAHARLARVLPGLTTGAEGLLTARQAARRLGVSVDYLRDHGEKLGIVVDLDGMLRYDPAAIARLRRRRQDQPPRD